MTRREEALQVKPCNRPSQKALGLYRGVDAAGKREDSQPMQPAISKRNCTVPGCAYLQLERSSG